MAEAKFRTPKGTHDVLPEDQRYMTYIKKAVRHRARQAGYQRIDTPLFPCPVFIPLPSSYLALIVIYKNDKIDAFFNFFHIVQCIFLKAIFFHRNFQPSNSDEHQQIQLVLHSSLP